MIGGDLAERLQAVVVKKIGAPGTIHALEQLTGGANRSTLAFEAELNAHRIPLIVQLGVETPDRAAGTTPDVRPADQARLMIAAAEAGAPAPRVRAILEPADGLGEGYITERVAGETLGPRIVRDERFAGTRPVIARQCGTILAAIHRIEPAKVPFLMTQDASAHLAANRRIADVYDFHLPALELAFRWLGENLPKRARHTVVHGDFRMGNLIVDESGVRCVLDWELAQLGDPMMDLGWLCIRTWRFGGSAPVAGVGSRDDLFVEYEQASGVAVEPADVRFWEAFGNVKWALHCLRLGWRGIEHMDIERCAIGRRIEEPLWDFLNLIEGPA